MTGQPNPTDEINGTDDVTGTYYDAGSGEFITATIVDGRIALHYADQSPDDATILVEYDSTTEFHDEEQDLTRVPDSVIEDPIPIAEDIYNEGFEAVIDGYNTATVMWVTEHTEIVQANTNRTEE